MKKTPIARSTLPSPYPVRSFMRAAVLARPGEFEIRETPRPEPGPGQVRVRVEGCGVCASNLPPFEGRPWFSYPFEPGAPGHEAWGRIDALGPGTESRWKIGQRVAVLSFQSYAEYDLAGESTVVALPDSLENLPVPGEPLACALNVFKRSGIGPGTTVAVVGAGFLGALLIQLATACGATVFAFSRRRCALETARACGAVRGFPLDGPEAGAEALEAVREATSGRLCGVVLEATGSQEPLRLAGELTSERGRLVIAGYHQDGQRQVDMRLWNWRGLDVINAHERDPRLYAAGMREAIAVLAAGKLKIGPLLTHSLPLEEINRAMALARSRPEGFLKALIRL